MYLYNGGKTVLFRFIVNPFVNIVLSASLSIYFMSSRNKEIKTCLVFYVRNLHKYGVLCDTEL